MPFPRYLNASTIAKKSCKKDNYTKLCYIGGKTNPENMEKMIDILLSTYNGELYLREQLESLVSQSEQEWILYIRDDGSTDGTLNIIHDFCSRFPSKIQLLADDFGNIGVIKSFELLLRSSRHEYIMFCD